MKKLIIELLGTFFLVFTLAMTGNPLAIASMLMAWIYIGGYISGGHYNPTVSLAMALRGRLSWEKFGYYAAAQIVGGFLAFATTTLLFNQIVIPQPGQGITLHQAFAVEVLLSFVFALVVLVVATSKRFNQSHIFGFAIGFTVPALAALGGPISGGLFNPAISLGASLFGAIKGVSIVWKTLAMYVGGSLLGGFFAASLYKYIFTTEEM